MTEDDTKDDWQDHEIALISAAVLIYKNKLPFDDLKRDVELIYASLAPKTNLTFNTKKCVQFHLVICRAFFRFDYDGSTVSLKDDCTNYHLYSGNFLHVKDDLIQHVGKVMYLNP
jgi:hypothetical protein